MKHSMNKHQSVNIVLLFLVLIFGFTIASLVKPQEKMSEEENRALALRPSFSLEDLLSGKFAEDYEAYLSDQFVGRNRWITLKTDFERLTGKNEINGVYFAKDDYLIESHDGTFTASLADQNVKTLDSFVRKLAQSYDADHLTVMIVPNAVDILRDKLPAFASPYDEEEFIDKVRAICPEGVFFDASKVLQSHRDEEIFYRTDHHWKSLAAYYAYQTWALQKNLTPASFTAQQVTDSFEGTISSKLGIRGKADSIERYDPDVPFDYYLVYNQSDDIRNSIYEEEYLAGKDKYSYFFGGNTGLIQAFMPDSRTGRKLLIIKDSYAHCFAPFTFANFDQVDLVDMRYYNASLSELVKKNGYTDVCVLFNAAGFAEETSAAKLLT